jgi:hypothetical protein
MTAIWGSILQQHGRWNRVNSLPTLCPHTKLKAHTWLGSCVIFPAVSGVVTELFKLHRWEKRTHSFPHPRPPHFETPPVTYEWVGDGQTIHTPSASPLWNPSHHMATLIAAMLVGAVPWFSIYLLRLGRRALSRVWRVVWWFDWCAYVQYCSKMVTLDNKWLSISHKVMWQWDISFPIMRCWCWKCDEFSSRDVSTFLSRLVLCFGMHPK